MYPSLGVLLVLGIILEVLLGNYHIFLDGRQSLQRDMVFPVLHVLP
jgi:hypothetical protein